MAQWLAHVLVHASPLWAEYGSFSGAEVHQEAVKCHGIQQLGWKYSGTVSQPSRIQCGNPILNGTGARTRKHQVMGGELQFLAVNNVLFSKVGSPNCDRSEESSTKTCLHKRADPQFLYTGQHDSIFFMLSKEAVLC